MYDIFLSYSSKDRGRVRAVFEALTQQGWSVFWDHLSIKTGANWRSKIEKEIKNSRCVIVVWSKDSIHSEFVLEEAEIAKKRKVLIPIAIDPVELPFGFSQRQTLNFPALHTKSAEPVFKKLCAEVRQLLDQTQQLSAAPELSRSPPPIFRRLFYLALVLLVIGWGYAVLTSTQHSVAVPKLEQRSLAALKSSGKLYIGTRNDVPPMGFTDDKGELIGIDIELAKVLASSLGLEPKWVVFKDIKQREELLIDRKVDVIISSYSITAERMQQVALSSPYFNSASVIMIRMSDQERLNSYQDLAQKKIAVLKNSINAQTIKALAPTANQQSIEGSMMQGYQQLAAQTVDAVVYDKPMIEYFIANHPHKNFMIMQGRPLDPNDYAIGVNLADSELLAHINQLLDYLNKTGELQKLAAKYSTASLIVEAAQQVEVTTDYTVKSGDTLSMIAFKVYGDPSLWEIIYAYNFQLKLIEYASLIRAGQTIKIPKRTQVD